MNHPDPPNCTYPDKYEVAINLAARHLLFWACFVKAWATSNGTSLDLWAINSPNCWPKTTASSNAAHSFWPRSGVIWCMASPATVILPMLTFPNMISHGNLCNSGAHVIVERSECCTITVYNWGKSWANLSITSFWITFGSLAMSLPTMQNVRTCKNVLWAQGPELIV